MLTREMLLHVFPNAKNVDEWVVALNEAWDKFQFNSKYERAAFLAIVGNETGGLVAVEENMNYSYARAAEVWPGKAGAVMQDRVSKGPVVFANWIYANILGNGNEASGDGWRYVGRGLIGITGRLNYRNTGKGIGIDLEGSPELVMQPKYGALAAAWFMASYIKIKSYMMSEDDEIFIAGANKVGSSNNPKVYAEIKSRRLEFRRRGLEALLPAGYVKKDDGNVKRQDIEQSRIVKDSNRGTVAATVATTATAIAPIVQSISQNWQVALVFVAAAVIAGIAAMIFFRRNNKNRREMHRDDIA